MAQSDQNHDHRAGQAMGDYKVGVGGPEEHEPAAHAADGAHYLDCDACRAQLARIVHQQAELESSELEDGSRDLDALLQVGWEAAAQARRMAEREELSRSFSTLMKGWQWIRVPLSIAFVCAVLVLGSLTSYLTWWDRSSQASEEYQLARLRDLYRNSRPLQARVTGGLAHQGYRVVRGPSGFTLADEESRLALLIELEHQAQVAPTAGTHHLLGKLYLLQGDYAPADNHLQLAWCGRSLDPDLHVDLGALYFERSRKAGHEDLTLLASAVEHFNTAIELNPELAEAWFDRALCHEQLRFFPEAASDWQRYLTLDSNSAWAEEARESLDRLRANLPSGETSSVGTHGFTAR